MKKLIFGIMVLTFLLLSACDGFSLSPSENGNNSNNLDDVLGMSSVVVPFYDVDGVTIRTTVGEGEQQTTYIKASEMQAMITAVDILMGAGATIGDFDGSFELSKLVTTSGYTPVLNSAIFHATLSRELFRLAEENNFPIPVMDEDENLIHIKQGTAEKETLYISKAEIQVLINALYQLMGDNAMLADFDGQFILEDLAEESGINVIFQSSILQATISERILDLADVNVPLVDQDENAIQVTVGDIENETTYIVKVELQSMVNALSILLGQNAQVEDFSGSISLSSIYNPDLGIDERDTILTSAIIHATVSKTLIDLDEIDGFIVVPEESIDGLISIKIVYLIGSNEDIFIIKSEIKNLIEAFAIMDYDNLELIVGIDSAKFYAEKDTILNSHILHATVSNLMIHETNGNLIVPNFEADAVTEIRVMTAGAIEYITRVEIIAILEALEAFGLLDFDTISMSPTNLFYDSALNPIDYPSHINASRSIQATISKFILELAEDESVYGDPLINATLVVPTTLREDTVVGEELLPGDNLIEIIDKDELIYLLDAIKELDLLNFDTAFNAELITDMDTPTLLYILRSGSIHVTIDVMLKDNDQLDIPNRATGTFYDLLESLVVKDEIVKLMLAVQTSGQLSFTTATFTDLNYFATLNVTDRGVIFDSLIVQKTLTPAAEAAITLYQVGNPGYVVPDTYYHDDNPLTFFTGLGLENVLNDLGLV